LTEQVQDKETEINVIKTLQGQMAEATEAIIDSFKTEVEFLKSNLEAATKDKELHVQDLRDAMQSQKDELTALPCQLDEKNAALVQAEARSEALEKELKATLCRPSPGRKYFYHIR
jgi:uncharacterized protein YPO0396